MGNRPAGELSLSGPRPNGRKEATAEDDQLIAWALRGRTEAYGELVRRYQDRLFNALNGFLGSPEDALDVTQEAFLSAWQALDGFKGGSRFYTWLYRIAMNLAIDLRRRQKPTGSLDLADDDIAQPPDPSPDADPQAALQRDEDVARVRQALMRVSEEHRMVLVLKDFEGMKYEEIAQVLEVPIGTIRSRLHRARLELRSVLERQEASESPTTE
ncbi:MAG: sigma-70 family RNA polymerase sigma factor [Gemmatales bacterium]|nr:sigma-70 family RNA polymerase sigma factor [Gemmatales bacterium]MDW8388327.1 sigma-70 family RNA polymerase sigma factor [Gemmatales bacterium]